MRLVLWEYKEVIGMGVEKCYENSRSTKKMSSGLNKVQLIANLGADPETKHLPSGSSVTNLRVAVSRKFKNREGESQEETEWFSVVCFDKLAETVQQYLTKGRKVYVEGRLKTNSWDDKTTGEKKYKTEIVAQDVIFLDSAKDREAVGAGASESFNSMPF